jgi:uncharacterized membrane protein
MANGLRDRELRSSHLLYRHGFAPLAAASFFAMALLAARLAYSGQPTHANLAWNLFLAWLPYLFALAAHRLRRRTLAALPLAALWLLFLPNAPYLLTDLIHLRPTAEVPRLYDAAMLLAFALAGIMLGLHSLYVMQRPVRATLGNAAAWLFALVVAVLSGWGVYIGRFLGWNSWDALTNPRALTRDLLITLTEPHLLAKAMAFALLVAAVMAVAHFLLARPPQDAQPRQNA